MSKRNRGFRSGRGFGPQRPTIPDEEEIMAMQVTTIMACKAGAEKLAELDPSKTKKEWMEWMMQQAEVLIVEALEKDEAGLENLLLEDLEE